MKRNRFRLLLALFLVAILFAIPAQAIGSETQAMEEVLVTFYQPPGQAEQELISSLGGTVKNVYSIVPVIAASVPAGSIEALGSDSRVRFVERDEVFFNSLEGDILPWGVDRVDAELVHPTYRGTGVKVAVLDTGIDLDHPDLAVAGDVTFVYGTANGDDDNGHGTLVAGIIGALDNEIGVIGVAPEAALYSVKVLNYNGNALMSNVLSGIDWAANNGMQVINMSFGSFLEMPASIQDALVNAYNAGIVLVAGAGNGGNAQGTGNNIWSPARYTSVIAVGATDENDVRTEVSSTGYQLELVAPGANIFSTAMGGGYAYISTTSSASPHVAGTAALLIDAGVTSNIEVRNRLQSTATDLGAAGWDAQYGQGLANAYAAVNFSEPPDQTAPTTTISLDGTPGTYGWYRSDVVVTLNAADNPGGSGLAETRYSVDGGTVWNTYTGPFTMTNEAITVLLARSWDVAGNDENPVFKTVKIDKTPPVVSETVVPTVSKRSKAGSVLAIQYTGTAQDAVSGVFSPTSTIVTDEYGVYNLDLGSVMASTAYVENWCENRDNDGRVYTFTLTVYDLAGNQAAAQATTTVIK